VLISYQNKINLYTHTSAITSFNTSKSVIAALFMY